MPSHVLLSPCSMEHTGTLHVHLCKGQSNPTIQCTYSACLCLWVWFPHLDSFVLNFPYCFEESPPSISDLTPFVRRICLRHSIFTILALYYYNASNRERLLHVEIPYQNSDTQCYCQQWQLLLSACDEHVQSLLIKLCAQSRTCVYTCIVIIIYVCLHI